MNRANDESSAAAKSASPSRPPMTVGRRIWRGVRIVALAYAIILVLMMVFEERLIFIPSKYPEGDWDTPGLPVEDAEFASSDGTQLHGWFLPHNSAKREKPRAVVLIAHGNAGNITNRAHLLASMRAAGAASMVFDYRGYGKSEGTPSEEGVLADARAARAWLAGRTGVAESAIVMMGESLGGGVAVDLAANDGAAGLILLSTFTSLPDVAARVYPWAPVRLLMRTRLNSLAIIPRYAGPVLQLHGDRDEIVPIDLAQRLFDAVPDAGKRFVTLRGGSHNAIPLRPFEDAVKAFFERL
ncbi:MAG: alpha/beta hydrolase [Pirellulales bacterium]